MKRLWVLICLTAGLVHVAAAQSVCASDGQATPVILIERFISADCEACWRAPPPLQPAARALTLDWIVPSPQGEEAPLSAAASPDALLRLEVLGHAAPATSLITSARLASGRTETLRVAHGVPLGGYIGASIQLKSRRAARLPHGLSAWLVLVETIAAGTDGTPIERYLVRNALQVAWNKPDMLLKTERLLFREMRPLSIPPGVTPERLRVVGWVQDGRGRVLSAARSVCAPSTPTVADQHR